MPSGCACQRRVSITLVMMATRPAAARPRHSSATAVSLTSASPRCDGPPGALLTLGRARGAKEKAIDAGEARALAAWMPAAHQAQAASLLVAGQRVAQEWVGYRYLTRNTAWHADLV